MLERKETSPILWNLSSTSETVQMQGHRHVCTQQFLPTIGKAVSVYFSLANVGPRLNICGPASWTKQNRQPIQCGVKSVASKCQVTAHWSHIWKVRHTFTRTALKSFQAALLQLEERPVSLVAVVIIMDRTPKPTVNPLFVHEVLTSRDAAQPRCW